MYKKATILLLDNVNYKNAEFASLGYTATDMVAQADLGPNCYRP